MDARLLICVTSLSVAFDSQAKASVVAAEFLKLKRCETAVSLLPGLPHDFVRQSLLSSSSFCFCGRCDWEVVGSGGDVYHLLLLKYFSSQKDGIVSPCPLAWWRPRSDSSLSTSSSHACRSSLWVRCDVIFLGLLLRHLLRRSHNFCHLAIRSIASSDRWRSVPLLGALEVHGAEPWVVTVLRWVTRSHLSPLFHFCSGSSAVFFRYHQRYTLLGELEGDIAYRDVELVPLSPGFYCHLFIDPFGFKVLATMVGLVVALRVCSFDSFSNGIASFCPPHCSEVRLDDLHRPQGCMSPGSHSSWQSRVCSVCCGQTVFQFRDWFFGLVLAPLVFLYVMTPGLVMFAAWASGCYFI